MKTQTNHGAVIDMESKPVNELQAGLAERLKEVFGEVVKKNLRHGFGDMNRVEREAWQAVADEVVKGRCQTVAVGESQLAEAAKDLHMAFYVMRHDWMDGDFSLPSLAVIHMQTLERKALELGKAIYAREAAVAGAAAQAWCHGWSEAVDKSLGDVAVFQEESTPNEIPITPPKGYRLVAHGERIQDGDIFCNGTVWRVTGSAGDLMSPRKHVHATRILTEPYVNLPAGLPPAPKIPEGYTRAVYRGEAWKSDEPAMFAVSFIGDLDWWTVDKPKPAEGSKDIHFIEFIK